MSGSMDGTQTGTGRHEAFREAIRWIADRRNDHPEAALPKLIAEAALRFDLSPKEAIALEHLLETVRTV